jgi:hypothetical protein
MAGIFAKGTLYIELPELYAFLATLNIRDIQKTEFSVSDDALKLTTPKSEEFVDAEVFWTWVRAKAVPSSLQSCEILFGVPFVDGPELHINFVVSSEGSLRATKDGMEILKEWKQ